MAVANFLGIEEHIVSNARRQMASRMEKEKANFEHFINPNRVL